MRRQRELSLLRQILKEGAKITNVHGIAGSGKTRLLESLIEELSGAGYAVAVIDFRHLTRWDPVAFMLDFAEQLNLPEAEELWRAADDTSVRLLSSLHFEPYVANAPRISVEVENNTFHGDVGDVVGIKLENVQMALPASELQRIDDERITGVTRAFGLALKGWSRDRPPVLVLDSCELLTEPESSDGRAQFSSWLWTRFMTLAVGPHGSLPQYVMAGRSRLNREDLPARAYESVHHVSLDGFTQDEARLFLELSCGASITEEAAASAIMLSRLNPLCLSLVASIVAAAPEGTEEVGQDVYREAETTLVTEFLVRRVLDQLEEPMVTALRMFAVPRKNNEHIFRATMTEPVAGAIALWRRILDFGFISPARGGGWEMHALVRSLILSDFRASAPHDLRAAHARLHRLYAEEVAEQNWMFVPQFPDMVYHLARADHRNVRIIAETYVRTAMRMRNVRLIAVTWDSLKEIEATAESAAWLVYIGAVAQLFSRPDERATGQLKAICGNAIYPPVLRLLAASSLAISEQRQGQLTRAADWAEKALPLSQMAQEDADDPTEAAALSIAACLNDLGTVLRTQIRLDAALTVYQRAEKVGRTGRFASSRWEAAYALLYQGVIHTGGLSDYAAAAAHFSAAEKEFGRLGDSVGVVMAIQRQGWLARMRGDLSKALEEHERAQRCLAEMSEVEPLLAGEVAHSTGNVLRQLERWEDARERYESALASFTVIGAERHLRLLAKDLGELLVRVGKIRRDLVVLAEGVARLEAVLGQNRAAGQERETSPILSLLGEALTELGNRWSAREYLEESLKIARDTRVPINESRALAKKAVLALDGQGFSDEDVRTLAEECVALSSAQEFWHYRAEGLMVLAVLAVRAGSAAEAVSLLRGSVESAVRYNAKKSAEIVSAFEKHAAAAVSAVELRQLVQDSLGSTQVENHGKRGDSRPQHLPVKRKSGGHP
ncbi:tetratricopeptide repeat protein [Streptomyces sp. NPDC001536]|uniref:tetratricopeptide repeat protein n=1 Tax=Streptomyces sp. NPDC001536 TaxID=3364583 RepID=UPI003685A7F8